MDEERFKRKVVAFTVGAVLLAFILICVVVYQLIAIGVSKKEQRRLDDQIAYYTSLIEDSENELDARRSKWYLELEARKLGYHYPEDKIFSGD